MSDNLRLGKIGEDIAGRFLLDNGYEILERNWRFKRAEIDIIAKDTDGILVFVEVKTRSYDYFGEPASFVDEKKQKIMADAASQYMQRIGYEWAVRFDIIGIIVKGEEKIEISHYKDAFFC